MLVLTAGGSRMLGLFGPFIVSSINIAWHHLRGPWLFVAQQGHSSHRQKDRQAVHPYFCLFFSERPLVSLTLRVTVPGWNFSDVNFLPFGRGSPFSVGILSCLVSHFLFDVLWKAAQSEIVSIGVFLCVREYAEYFYIPSLILYNQTRFLLISQVCK